RRCPRSQSLPRSASALPSHPSSLSRAPSTTLVLCLTTRRPPIPPRFPYTTLFRSELPDARFWEGRYRVLTLHPDGDVPQRGRTRSEEHTSELQSRFDLVCRLLLEKKEPAAQGRHALRGSVGGSEEQCDTMDAATDQ